MSHEVTKKNKNKTTLLENAGIVLQKHFFNPRVRFQQR